MGYFRPLSQTKFINDTNLVSYWKLDGNSNDSKGSNNGTDTAMSYITGLFDNCGVFNGSTSFITKVDPIGITTLTSYTISLWVKRNLASSYQQLVGCVNKYQNFSGAISLEWANDNKFYMNHQNGSSDAIVGSTNAFSDTSSYHHIVVTHTGSGGTTNIYFDNTLIASGTQRDPDFGGSYRANTYLNLGGVWNGTLAIPFDGNEDDVSIFSRALSAGEVAELYQSMTLGEYLPNSNTKLLLHLNGSSADSSGNNNNGTDTAITYSQANGKFGQGAGFNGSSSKIEKTGDLAISSSTPFTFSTWIKQTSIPASNTLDTYLNKVVSSATVGSNFYLRYHNNSGTLNMRYEGTDTAGSLQTITYPVTLSTGIWYNLIMTWDGSNTLKGYFNGLYIGTSSPNNNANIGGSSTTIFGVDAAGSHFFDGCQDEIILENVAWSAEKVKKYFTNSKGRFGII